jgi:hypothetical protein
VKINLRNQNFRWRLNTKLRNRKSEGAGHCKCSSTDIKKQKQCCLVYVTSQPDSWPNAFSSKIAFVVVVYNMHHRWHAILLGCEWRILPSHTRGSCDKYWKSNSGQPTWGDPSAKALGVGLTTVHHKIFCVKNFLNEMQEEYWRVHVLDNSLLEKCFTYSYSETPLI